VKGKDIKYSLRCTHDSCKKKYGRTKQVGHIALTYNVPKVLKGHLQIMCVRLIGFWLSLYSRYSLPIKQWKYRHLPHLNSEIQDKISIYK